MHTISMHTMKIEDGRLIIPGNSNHDLPGQDYADKMAQLTDHEFVEFAADAIHWSAWANNNPRSDYHWQADACHYESMRRCGGDKFYRAAFRIAVINAGHRDPHPKDKETDDLVHALTTV